MFTIEVSVCPFRCCRKINFQQNEQQNGTYALFRRITRIQQLENPTLKHSYQPVQIQIHIYIYIYSCFDWMVMPRALRAFRHIKRLCRKIEKRRLKHEQQIQPNPNWVLITVKAVSS